MGCTKCTKQTSRPELRIFSELRPIFPDILHRQRLNSRIECDLVIPSIKAVVEFDGMRYHAGKYEIDLRKTKSIEILGYRVVRIRDSSLGLMAITLVIDESKGIGKDDILRLLDLLIIQGVTEEQSSLICQYRESQGFWGDIEYASLVAGISSPALGRSLAELAPDICHEWHPTLNGELRPEDVSFGSAHLAYWVCTKAGHVYRASVGARVGGRNRRRGNCPFCNRRAKVCAPEYSLQVRFPLVAAQLDPELNDGASALGIYAKSNTVYQWRCQTNPGHTWRAPVYARVAKGAAGCPFCSGRRAAEDRSLEKVRPKLALEWDLEKNAALLPSQVVPGSQRRVWWRCLRNPMHSWVAPINNRSREKNPSGCPQCVGKRPKTQI